jgi:transaldolase
MQFFLDSAILDEIKYGLEYLYIDGVTTNPRHVQVAQKPFLQTIKEIAELVEGTEKTVSVEVNPHLMDFEKIIAEARKLAKISPNFVIKLQCVDVAMKAVPILKEEGIRSNVTLVFSAVQALQAMRLGAYYVSPFVGWKETNGESTDQFLEDIMEIKAQYGFKTQVIAAAIRTGHQVVTAAALGVDIVTAGVDVYKAALDHPYTWEGIKRFSNFWDQTPYDILENN